MLALNLPPSLPSPPPDFHPFSPVSTTTCQNTSSTQSPSFFGDWLVLRKTSLLKNRTRRLMHFVFDVPQIKHFSTPRKRIAYIKRGVFSYTNIRVGELLKEQFPDHEIEHIDLFEDILLRKKHVIAKNLFHILKHYGWDILRGRRSIQHCFYRTPYMFRMIKKLVREHLAQHVDEYAFSIQTQSLYDASVEELPHFVYTDHTHLANLYYPGFDRRKLFAREWIDLEKDIYRNAQRVFIMSHHVKQSIVEQYACDGDRVSCVYAGSHIEQQLAPDNDGYGNKQILFVGVDWERKGGPQLLEAFAHVLKKVPDARLVIVGCSPRVDLPNVTVVGRVPLEEVKKHMRKASVFCLPTRIEPFGIVTVEAFAHKIPVVATRVGALPDLVQDGKSGRLVDLDDVPALSKSLTELITDPEKCRRFGEHGHRAVKDQYSWQAVGERLRQEIMPLLEEPASV